MSIETFIAYALPMTVVWAVYVGSRRSIESRSMTKLAAARRDGLLEPASLHPVIDVAKCLGCGSCVRACPEGNILGLINGKAELVEPSHCIGHGACKAACPANAITLVFGTERRGVDIPNVGPDFQTNVPGIFIAGELGGMGLVRNAIEQGRQAIESIRNAARGGPATDLDVVIVGCGPAGFSASLAALHHKLRFVTLEQDTLGGTVAHFPRGKLVMTAPFVLPLAGKYNFKEMRKEELVGLFEGIAEQTGLEVNFNERVEKITRASGGFEVKTPRGTYRTRAVLLTIGRRGTPRKLEVPGSEHEKVVYRLVDPEQFRNKHVVIVGGGDSALEAAFSIAEQPGSVVTLSHRSESFNRAKLKNRKKIEDADKSGRLNVVMSSVIHSISDDALELEHAGERFVIRNDAVIACLGGILPTPFLQSVGVEVETKYGTV